MLLIHILKINGVELFFSIRLNWAVLFQDLAPLETREQSLRSTTLAQGNYGNAHMRAVGRGHTDDGLSRVILHVGVFVFERTT